MRSGHVVTFGEVMLRLNPPGFQQFRQAAQFEVQYGGGEANVAASLSQFCIPVRYVTRLPKNDLGSACAAKLMAIGVDVRFINWGGDRIGIYFLENGVAQRPSKVIYDRQYSSFSSIQPGMINWMEVFDGASWFHWTGITPAVSSSAADTCQEALEAAKKAGLLISCDLNYRAKLWNWTSSPGAVMERLVRDCDLIIGNEEDADRIFGIKAPETTISSGKIDPEKYSDVCKQLAKMVPHVKTVAITLRGSISASMNDWSAVMWQAGKFYVGPQYQISPIVDRVGGGDSFAAGLIYSFLKDDQDPQKALNFAVAASCLKHTIPGDTNLVTLQEVEQLVNGDQSGRISR